MEFTVLSGRSGSGKTKDIVKMVGDMEDGGLFAFSEVSTSHMYTLITQLSVGCFNIEKSVLYSVHHTDFVSLIDLLDVATEKGCHSMYYDGNFNQKQVEVFQRYLLDYDGCVKKVVVTQHTPKQSHWYLV